jgi:hypothetical protein
LPLGFWLVLQITVWIDLPKNSSFDAPELVAERLRMLEVAVTATVIVAMLLYGLHRVTSFHPLFDDQYREWLCQTPYDGSQPLPLGPVALDWRDAVFVSVFVPLGIYSPHLQPFTGPILFLCAYLAIVGLCLWITRQDFAAWLLCLGLAVVVVSYHWKDWVPFGLAISLLAGSGTALTRTVDPIRWGRTEIRMQASEFMYILRLLCKPGSQPQGAGRPTNEPGQKPGASDGGSWVLGGKPEAIGWPLAALGPAGVSENSRMLSAAAFGVLLFAWIMAIILLFPEVERSSNRESSSIAVLIASSIGAGIRIIVYCAVLHPPISLAGRFATGQFFIPRYDRVLATPILTPIAAWIVFHTLQFDGLTQSLPIASGLGAALFILLAGGPSIRTWALTGNHRIRGASFWSGALKRI